MTFDDLGDVAADLASLPVVAADLRGFSAPGWLKKPAVLGGLVAGLVGWFFGGPIAAIALVVLSWLAVRAFRDQVGL